MKIKVSVAIEKELVARLDKIAAVSNESRSQVIERMVRDEIESTEQFANLMANPQAREMLMTQLAKPEVLNPMLRAMQEKPTKEMREKLVLAVETMGKKAEDVKKGKKS